MVRSLSMFLGNDGTTSVPKFDDDLFIFSVQPSHSVWLDGLTLDQIR